MQTVQNVSYAISIVSFNHLGEHPRPWQGTSCHKKVRVGEVQSNHVLGDRPIIVYKDDASLRAAENISTPLITNGKVVAILHEI